MLSAKAPGAMVESSASAGGVGTQEAQSSNSGKEEVGPAADGDELRQTLNAARQTLRLRNEEAARNRTSGIRR